MEMKTLTETLSTQLRLLEELCAILDRETRELTDMNLDAMAEVNRVKEELTERIEAYTAPLRQAISTAAVDLGLAPDVPLGRVVVALGSKKSEIPRLYRELNATAQRVQDVAGLNREIAERFTATVSTTLSFLTRIINQSSVYGASGGYQQRPAGSVMINKEA